MFRARPAAEVKDTDEEQEGPKASEEAPAIWVTNPAKERNEIASRPPHRVQAKKAGQPLVRSGRKVAMQEAYRWL